MRFYLDLIHGLHRRTPLELLLIFMLWSTIATACSSDQNLLVEDAWARPALSGDNGAVYFEVKNPGSGEDAIRGASSDVAAQVEIHESTLDSAGTMSMHPQHSVAIPAGGRVIFEPGGLHVMLVSVNQDLEIGDSFQVTLTFDHSAAQTIDVEVKQP